jgi:hypothetical protein
MVLKGENTAKTLYIEQPAPINAAIHYGTMGVRKVLLFPPARLIASVPTSK